LSVFKSLIDIDIQYGSFGSGSIADHLEDFFEIIGVEVPTGGYKRSRNLADYHHVRRPWRERGSGRSAFDVPEPRLSILILSTTC
jgi:long-chain acyl-CoA synthetase